MEVFSGNDAIFDNPSSAWKQDWIAPAMYHGRLVIAVNGTVVDCMLERPSKVFVRDCEVANCRTGQDVHETRKPFSPIKMDGDTVLIGSLSPSLQQRN